MAITTTVFVPDDEFARSTDMQDILYGKAEDAVEIAKSIAPVVTGAYRDSIHPERGAEGPVAVAYVVASDYKAIWIEFGTEDPVPTPAFAVLRRSIDGIGLLISEDSDAGPA
jgi:hypothetical protein